MVVHPTVYNCTPYPPICPCTSPFSPFFSTPGHWVEGPMSWPTCPVRHTVVPSPPGIYIFPTQLHTVMLYFSFYCRPEGNLLISRNPWPSVGPIVDIQSQFHETGLYSPPSHGVPSWSIVLGAAGYGPYSVWCPLSGKAMGFSMVG